MKYFQLISLLLLFNSEVLFSLDNAYTTEEGAREMGIFRPRIYGMKNNIEVSTHPLLFLIKPNIKVIVVIIFAETFKNKNTGAI